MIVDVSQVPQPEKEEEVILLGTDGRQKISSADIAAKINTISYEIVTRINPLLPRVVIA
jgi:alanine racemase